MEAEHKSKYNGFFTQGGNYVWGGAMGLAWNELIDKFVKEHIKVLSNDPNVLKIVSNFNTNKFSQKDISEKCIYVKSGYGQETVNKINFECKKKFPEKSFKDLDIKLGPKDIISYAYLLKKLEFTVKFELYKEGKFFFEEKEVPSFYASNKKQKNQIKWFSYKNKDQFLIKIDTKNSQDQIFFIKDHKINNIDDAIAIVMNNEMKAGALLNEVDRFMMPLVELDARRNIEELEGQIIGNKNLQNYQFSIVYEAIKLKIDESGAKVENEAVMTLEKSCIRKELVEPKEFIFDKPFWVVMKEKGKHPYFTALIKNPTDK